MKTNKILISVFSLFLLSSCNYEEINTNPYGITDEQFKQGGLAYGASLMTMQQTVIPIGPPSLATNPGNHLQNTDLISSGNYIGYFGNNNNFGNNTEATWNFVEGRMKYAYDNFYSNIFRAWNEIYQLTSKSDDAFDIRILAVANIVKILAWLRATDVFGPIVYSQAGDGDIAPKLDSQEEVYRKMLSDLSKAVNILNLSTAAILKDYDLVYNGDPNSWIKLANSLMLRMAVRVHFKDKALATEYITKALDPQNGGVIESRTEEAKMQTTSKLPLHNSMIPSVEEYQETRMGTTIWGYLTGYNDPRIEAYFTKGTYSSVSDYYPVAPTSSAPKGNGANTAAMAAKPKVESATPLYWLRASEVLFLKAEAALYGMTSGSAQQFYEDGVKMSFEENNVGNASAYLQQTNLPNNMTIGAYKYGNYSDNISNGNVSPKWDDAITEEQKLQKIITQKYLALYPNAVEAWTEYRRTGFPFIMKPQDDAACLRINAAPDCLAPERFRFAPSEYSNNPNMYAVPSLLGGADEGSTLLWWVRTNRPKK
ncbi:MAG: SusD/RagB family nutrient-binding outer membrane lipoprotein [Bacteroidales bacterium]